MQTGHDKQLGWKKPILGSDSWSSDELVKLCGKDCLGSFFVSHYASAGAEHTKEFIDRYKAKYGAIPDDVAALTWDAIGLIGQGIKNAGTITGDIKKDRDSVRNAVAAIRASRALRERSASRPVTATPSDPPISSKLMTRVNSVLQGRVPVKSRARLRQGITTVEALRTQRMLFFRCR